MLRLLANGMGKYIEVDLSGTESSKGGNFLRFKVEIKSSAPLLKGFWLERTQLSDLWVQLKYERLPDFCYLCGRLGHMKKECTKSGAREEGDEALDRNLKNTEKQGGTSHSRIVVEGGASASELHAVDERVEELVSLSEADVRLKKVSAGNVGDLTGSREQFHPMPVKQDDAGVPFVSQRVEATLVNTPLTCGPTGISLTNLESVISPQLVISFGPVGPIEKQIVPVGLSLTQAHFMAWPSVIHAEDLQKPKSLSVTIKEIKEVGHVPMDIATLVVGCAGGLILGWKAEVDIEVTVANKNIINAIVFSSPPNQPWMLTVVYAPPSKSRRTLFWDHLKKLSDSFPGPWICVGDFNCIKEQSEKAGGKPFASSSNSELGGFLFDCNLIDLGFCGNSFTWSNKRKGQANIKERLDRAVTNVGWRSLFPRASVRHLPATSSDHNPILVNTMGEASSGPKPFKFETGLDT
uniref:CCHC-type domain-containing protein n=1 Tax=Fagus sylvatica TaxID=28930 RepID=A0A2N9IET1_FAGSY